MLASTVSSKFLAKLAEVNGFLFEETLTGFKWIGNRAQALEEQGYNSVFAFEEAIGFTVGKVVRDKDGVSALGFFAEWAIHLHNRGQSANDYLESLYQKYGYFVTDNSYFICRDPETIKKIFVRMRFGDHPVSYIYTCIRLKHLRNTFSLPFCMYSNSLLMERCVMKQWFLKFCMHLLTFLFPPFSISTSSITLLPLVVIK
jgi:hypothetical protein